MNEVFYFTFKSMAMKHNSILKATCLTFLVLMSSYSFSTNMNRDVPVKYYYWILHSSNQAWFTGARYAASDQECANDFKTYCERHNFMQYTRRVEGPFNDPQALSKSRTDAKNQWQRSGYQVIDWNP
jgi:hypothetical protein